jgi:hypothetical protein
MIMTMVLLIFPAVLTYAGSAADRDKAFKMLYTAYQQYTTGNDEEGRKGVEAALKIDPNLAYGNIVRGEIGMKDQDWPTAQKYYEKGLLLLKQNNQPLSPDPKTKVTIKEVEGDTRCFLGYVYIKQAQLANRSGNEKEEQRYLELANKSLRAGLKLSPGKEARELAEGLIKKFR